MNSRWKDRKYISIISSSLRGFKTLSNAPFLALFRCPYCGDSKKSNAKKRAYFIEEREGYYFYCHNCFTNRSIQDFLKDLSLQLYEDYRYEDFKETAKEKETTIDVSKFKTKTRFKKEINFGVSIREDRGIVREYAEKRKIPEEFYDSLYSSRVCDIVKQLKRYSFHKTLIKNKDVCLVIPFFTDSKDCSYIALRTVEDTSFMRYLVLEILDECPKIWGLDRVDWNQEIFIFEGQIDAMMVSNSLSLSGAGGGSSVEFIKRKINNRDNVIFVYDNELKKNDSIRRQAELRIEDGFRVFIPDYRFNGIKDANEAIVNGLFNQVSLRDYIKQRSFCDMMAELELSDHLRKRGK